MQTNLTQKNSHLQHSGTGKNPVLGQYELWQLERFGNILPASGRVELENGHQERDRSDRWMDAQSEQQLIDPSYQ